MTGTIGGFQPPGSEISTSNGVDQRNLRTASKLHGAMPSARVILAKYWRRETQSAWLAGFGIRDSAYFFFAFASFSSYSFTYLAGVALNSSRQPLQQT